VKHRVMSLIIACSLATALGGCQFFQPTTDDKKSPITQLTPVTLTPVPVAPFDNSGGTAGDKHPAAGDIEFLIAQGEKAMKDGHWTDAAGWFKRAEILAGSRNQKRLDAALWQSIGICMREAGNYNESMKALMRAKIGFDHCGLGAMNAKSAQVTDDIASVYILTKDYENAFRCLNDALEYAEGKWTGRTDGFSQIPYRVERLVALSIKLKRPADGYYQQSLTYLAKFSDPLAQRAQQKIMACWKQHLDRGDYGVTSGQYEAMLATLGPSVAPVVVPVVAPPQPALTQVTSPASEFKPAVALRNLLNGSASFQTSTNSGHRPFTGYESVTPRIAQDSSPATSGASQFQIPEWFRKQQQDKSQSSESL
jgi:tetratricopeptide (TPR) repeat protein